MVYLMKSKYAIFSNIRVTKIERSAFWGDTRYNLYTYFYGSDRALVTRSTESRQWPSIAPAFLYFSTFLTQFSSGQKKKRIERHKNKIKFLSINFRASAS